MKIMNIIKILIFLPILAGGAWQARAAGFPAKDLPSEGKSLSDFVPGGWIVEDRADGDFNGDGILDVAAILVQGGPDFDIDKAEDERRPALIVLLGHGENRFSLAGINDRLLQCKGCGGVKEMEGVGVRKGVVVVSQWMGSREFSKTTWRFRHDPQQLRFIMIGKDIESGDGMRGTGTIESFNYLTGRKITETYRYDENGERKIATSTKKETGPRKTPFIEDVQPEY